MFIFILSPVLGLMRRLPAGMELTSEATQYTCCPPLMPPTDPATHNTCSHGWFSYDLYSFQH